jgi:hypothetical protein
MQWLPLAGRRPIAGNALDQRVSGSETRIDHERRATR